MGSINSSLTIIIWHNLISLKFNEKIDIVQVIHLPILFFSSSSSDTQLNLILADQLVNTTISWMNWMPHIRVLNIEHELLSQLTVNNISVHQFVSLEVLVLRQIESTSSNEPLTVLSRVGTSSSLHVIHLQQYRAGSHLSAVDLQLVFHQICHNLSRLQLMTIEFHPDALFDNQILDRFTDMQKKNSQLDYISVSNTYMELCFAQWFSAFVIEKWIKT